MMKMTKIGTVIASLLVVGVANAAAPGAYVGLGAGASIIRTPNLNPIDMMGIKTSEQRGGLGGRVFAGYNFNQYVGLETSLATYAKSTYKISGMGQSFTMKDSLYALSLVGKGYLPLSDTGLSAYVLGGLAEVRNEVSVTGNGTDHTNSLRPTYGLGISYDTTSHVTTSLELSRIQGKGNMNTDSDAIPTADMVSLNIGYNFG